MQQLIESMGTRAAAGDAGLLARHTFVHECSVICRHLATVTRDNKNMHSLLLKCYRLPKIINFPDFEEQFEIFENLQSLHVSVNLANTQGHKGRSQLLMTGLQLPMLARKGEVAEGEPDQPAAADDGAADLPLEASEYDAEGPDAADS